jgi:outer membrane biosynthesis protein TonB
MRFGSVFLIAAVAAAPAAAQQPPFSIYRDTATARSIEGEVAGGVAEAPVLRSCGQPQSPVGTLLGSGWVSYTVLPNGRMDSTTLRVDSVQGISEAGLLSAARRLFSDCRYRPARQAKIPVAVPVRHRVAFETRHVVGVLATPQPDSRSIEEMPAVGRCNGLSTIYPRGSVRLSFVIGVDGWAEPESVQVLESSNPTLHRAAATLARRCRYAPGRVGGEPVRVLVTQRFTFSRGR